MNRNNKEVSAISLYGTRALLLASGLIAAGIATTILIAPDAFYQGYGIDISTNVSLANELKAPAGALLLAGFLMMAGVFKVGLTIPSLGIAAAVYLSYGLSRILSMAIDGAPHSGLVSAAAIEVVVGAVCLVVLMRQKRTNISRRIVAEDSWHAGTEEGAA